jgi:hypothetical protein
MALNDLLKRFQRMTKNMGVSVVGLVINGVMARGSASAYVCSEEVWVYSLLSWILFSNGLPMPKYSLHRCIQASIKSCSSGIQEGEGKREAEGALEKRDASGLKLSEACWLVPRPLYHPSTR